MEGVEEEEGGARKGKDAYSQQDNREGRAKQMKI